MLFFTSEEVVPFTSIVMDLAPTLFTPETPKGFVDSNTSHPTSIGSG